MQIGFTALADVQQPLLADAGVLAASDRMVAAIDRPLANCRASPMAVTIAVAALNPTSCESASPVRLARTGDGSP